MNNFDTLFPNFLDQCTQMNHVLTPIAFVLLAIGIVSSTVTGHRSPSAYLRTIGRTFAFAAVLAYLPTWSNEIASTVDSTVRDTLHADPAGVYQQYQKALAINKGTSGTTSGSKSMVGCAGWASDFRSPHFRHDVAARIHRQRHRLLRVSRSEIHSLHWLRTGADLHRLPFSTYGLQNLLGLAALALWLISSTIAAPIIIQKAIATGIQVGQALATTTVIAGTLTMQTTSSDLQTTKPTPQPSRVPDRRTDLFPSRPPGNRIHDFIEKLERTRF
jgi:hypothetical protein